MESSEHGVSDTASMAVSEVILLSSCVQCSASFIAWNTSTDVPCRVCKRVLRLSSNKRELILEVHRRKAASIHEKGADRENCESPAPSNAKEEEDTTLSTVENDKDANQKEDSDKFNECIEKPTIETENGGEARLAGSPELTVEPPATTVVVEEAYTADENCLEVFPLYTVMSASDIIHSIYLNPSVSTLSPIERCSKPEVFQDGVEPTGTSFPLEDSGLVNSELMTAACERGHLMEVWVCTVKGLHVRLWLDQRHCASGVWGEVEVLQGGALGGRVTHALMAPQLATSSGSSVKSFRHTPLVRPPSRTPVLVLAVYRGGDEGSAVGSAGSEGVTEIVASIEETDEARGAWSSRSGSLTASPHPWSSTTAAAPRRHLRSLFRCKGELSSLILDPIDRYLFAVSNKTHQIEVFHWSRGRVVTSAFATHLSWSCLKYGRPARLGGLWAWGTLWLGTDLGHVLLLPLPPRPLLGSPDGCAVPLPPLAHSESVELSDGTAPVQLALCAGGREVWMYRSGETCWRAWDARQRILIRVVSLEKGVPWQLPFWLSSSASYKITLECAVIQNDGGAASRTITTSAYTRVVVPSSSLMLWEIEASELQAYLLESAGGDQKLTELITFFHECLTGESAAQRNDEDLTAEPRVDPLDPGERLEQLLSDGAAFAAAARIQLALEHHHACRERLARYRGASDSCRGGSVASWGSSSSLLEDVRGLEGALERHSASTEALQSFLSALEPFARASGESVDAGESVKLETLEDVLEWVISLCGADDPSRKGGAAGQRSTCAVLSGATPCFKWSQARASRTGSSLGGSHRVIPLDIETSSEDDTIKDEEIEINYPKENSLVKERRSDESKDRPKRADKRTQWERELYALQSQLEDERARRIAAEQEAAEATSALHTTNDLLSRREEQVELMKKKLLASQHAAEREAAMASSLLTMEGRVAEAQSELEALRASMETAKTYRLELEAKRSLVEEQDAALTRYKDKEKLAKIVFQEFMSAENDFVQLFSDLKELSEKLCEDSESSDSEEDEGYVKLGWLENTILESYRIVVDRIQQQKQYFHDLKSGLLEEG